MKKAAWFNAEGGLVKASIRWWVPGVVMAISGPVALANVHDTFGVGAAAISMGNAQTASASGGSAAYYNPAGLVRKPGIRLDAGLQAFVPQLKGFENIVYDFDQDGVIETNADGTPESTSVLTAYRPTIGNGITAAIPITSWLAAGVSMYMPSEYLMRIEFEDPYVPYYPLYKSRTQKFSTFVGAGVKVFDGLYVGAGASVSATAVINGRVTSAVVVNTASTSEDGTTELTQVVSQVTINNMSLQLKSAMAPTAGVIFNFGWMNPALAGLNIGASYRGYSSVKTQVDVTVNAYADVSMGDDEIYSGPLTSAPTAISQTMESGTNPAQASGGISYTYKDAFTLSADATWVKWEDYIETMIAIPNQTITVEGAAQVTVGGGRETDGDPGYVYQNTITPRVGMEYTGPMPVGGDMGFKFSVRAGYGYHPSPLPEQTERVNMLDSNKHMVSGGLGFEIPLPRLANPLRVDTFFTAHLLEDRLHSKDTSIIGANGEYPVGYPVANSITSGGAIFGGGGSVGLTF